MSAAPPGSDPAAAALIGALAACRLCAADFARSASRHQPRPVVWFSPGARVLIAGQAPGVRVHASGRPFTDPSGDRLRDWLGLEPAAFYDRARIAIVPMAFCFPGDDGKGGDLPPPRRCAEHWRAPVMATLPAVRLTFLVGAHAQRWHLGVAATTGGVTATVARWRDHAPRIFVLPHPSWRNSGWLKRNPWFADDLLPAARAALDEVMADG
ncbi:MAG: uracil-DNA glycosylase [Alphaproteobacteria bacterium HGW-Alphaproteobacteria-6]|nr:MAG: uracil-DNA glycosylase [Alphaproteobacteria bacterium HGW-Alphaproteobacteria-6]